MNKCKLKIIGNRILVEEKIFDKKTKGGIYLPENELDRYQNMTTEGKIVAMGETAFEGLCPGTIAPRIHDIVYFQKYDGLGKRYNNKNYRILSDEEVFATSERYIEDDEDILDG